MKKIYAMEVNSEYFDSDVYYNEESATLDHVSVCGNQRLAGVNVAMVADIQNALNACVYDFEDPNESKEDRSTTIHYEFGYLMQGEPTDDQLQRIYDSIESYVKGGLVSEKDEICDLLEIVYGEKFVRNLIRGCCQGDWNYCYLPESKLDLLPYVEAVYFGTGTEFAIAPLDNMEGKSAEEVTKAILGSLDHYYDYTELSDPAKIKEHVAELEGADPKDVVLIRISGTRTTVIYDYAIA